MKKNLPLLDFASEIFKDVKLDNVLLIASQHILETQRIMFQYFMAKGLKPENIFLIGKCYSTNHNVLKRFEKMGVNVSKNSEAFVPSLSFDEQFGKYTKEWLDFVYKKVNLGSFDKIIILEDGGNLISHANEILNKYNLVGIEQTSAGYEKLKIVKLKFPVINVARSHAKLTIESPIIAETFMEKLYISLNKLKLNPKNALIIGAGAVGNSIYERLSKRIEVKRFDLNNEISDFKEKELKSILGNFDLIIGSTGKEIINPSLYSYLKKDVIMASASSSDREFSAVNLRKNNILDCHDIVYFDNKYLLNCGFPMTFDGEEDSSKPEDIQITMSLLFSAVCLARKESYKNGLIDLDKNIQELIVKKFKEL